VHSELVLTRRLDTKLEPILSTAAKVPGRNEVMLRQLDLSGQLRFPYVAAAPLAFQRDRERVIDARANLRSLLPRLSHAACEADRRGAASHPVKCRTRKSSSERESDLQPWIALGNRQNASQRGLRLIHRKWQLGIIQGTFEIGELQLEAIRLADRLAERALHARATRGSDVEMSLKTVLMSPRCICTTATSSSGFVA
jgi:hypothetical protein